MSKQADSGEVTTISIVEDNRFVREAWTAVLAAVPDFVLRAEFASCEEALASQAIGESDVVVMDIGLPGMSGIQGVSEIQKAHPHVATVICTIYEDDQKVFDALCAGAVGYLLKDIDPVDLSRAIREAAGGGSPMSPTIARKVIAYFQKPPAKPNNPADELSERESETLKLLSEGKSYAEIARQSFITIDAVRSRIRNIYLKLQVHSRGEAVAKGISSRIIKPL